MSRGGDPTTAQRAAYGSYDECRAVVRKLTRAGMHAEAEAVWAQMDQALQSIRAGAESLIGSAQSGVSSPGFFARVRYTRARESAVGREPMRRPVADVDLPREGNPIMEGGRSWTRSA